MVAADQNIVPLIRFSIDLVVRQEQYYYDTQQWEELRNTWHPDANKTSVHIASPTASIDGNVDDRIALGKAEQNGPDAQSITSTSVVIQPLEIQVNKNRALVTSLITTRSRFRYKGCMCELETRAHRVQRLESSTFEAGSLPSHSDPQWYIVGLDTIYMSDGLTLPFPQKLGAECIQRASLDIAGASSSRSSYCVLAWRLGLVGGEVSGKWPGYDDPRTWRPLMDLNQRWATGDDVSFATLQ